VSSVSNSRKWLRFGVIVLALGCIGTFWALDGFSTIQTLLSLAIEDTPTATIEIIYPTETIGVEVITPSPEPTVNPIPFEAVVKIVAVYEENGKLKVGWTGSGSIISSDGFILTNAHVVLPNHSFPEIQLKVEITLQDDHPPEAMYFAEVLQADEPLDIAVIRITTDLDGNPVDHANLNLPYVPLGDADFLHLGDPITILGYPGTGGETITLTRGEVSGFTTEEGLGDRAFIKTSATITGGNSGGLAADIDGYLIGIPTQLGYGGEDRFVDCRVLADTNGDGKIDNRDSCIPIGGFINALRPINLAFPLIEAAKEGLVVVNEGQSHPPGMELPDQGPVLYEDDFSDPSTGWSWQGQQGQGSRGYVNGELHIEVLLKNFTIRGTAGESFSDVVIDVDVNVVKSTGDADFGVLCRFQDGGNYYGLEITETGYFIIWKNVGGVYMLLMERSVPSFVMQNIRETHFTVACVGDTLALAIDGELLAVVRDSDLTSGDVGLIAGTLETPGVIVGFDNFRVSSPDS